MTLSDKAGPLTDDREGGGVIGRLMQMTQIPFTFRGWLPPTAMLPLARTLASNSRLRRWAAKVEGRTVKLTTRQGRVALRTPLLDAWPAFEVFAFHEYDFPFLRWDRIRTVVDCGAHVGSFSLWVARKAPCEIIAVEPNPHAFELLQSNVSPLGSRIRLLRAAVAGTPSERLLYDSGYPSLSSLVLKTREASPLQVRAMTLEQLFSDSGFDRIDLLKMDIEGTEQEVFESTPLEILKIVQAAVIECHPSAGAHPEMIRERLSSSGMNVAGSARVVTAWRD